MKKIDIITRGKCDLVEKIINRKSARVMRGVEQAIAYADDKLDEYSDRLESIMESFASCCGGEDTEALKATIQNYVNTADELSQWEKSLDTLKSLKKKLNEDVPLTDGQEK